MVSSGCFVEHMRKQQRLDLCCMDQMRKEDWLAPAAIDQRTLYQGNTVLRGGQIPVVEPKSSAKRATNP
jgi:hypothetical protein